jgi:hypothetical protein
MVTHNWQLLAKLLAIIAHQRLGHFQRAAFSLDANENNLIIAVFGNDGYSSNRRSRQEVESFRQGLLETGNKELGFSLSPDGETWVLLMKPNLERNQTYVAKIFQLEMLKSDLDDFVDGTLNPFLAANAQAKGEAVIQHSS